MTVRSKELVLRDKIQAFVRAFGLLRNQTPCGMPISISMAHALMVLKTTQGDVTQSQLQKTLSLDKSNVTRLCLSLESEGFVTQRKSESDGRARIVTLTKKGERFGDSLLEASRKRFIKILAHIPKREQARLFESLDLLTHAILETNKEN